MSFAPTVAAIESWLGRTVPSEYRKFLDTCEVEFMASDIVLLYGRSAFIERNETYESKEYCPGFVTVGNDSGNMEIVMSLQDGSLHLVEGGSMRISDLESLDTFFSTWFKANCPLPEYKHDSEEWPFDPLTQVCIYLESKPASLSNLLMIKRHLKIENSIADLKASVDCVPTRIAEGITYAQAKGRCLLVDQKDSCLGIRLSTDESIGLSKEKTHFNP